MAKLKRRNTLLCEIESTYNVDPVPTGADAVLVENMEWSFTGQRMHEREGSIGTLSSLKQIFGGTLIQLTFDVLIKGSGAAGTPPEFGKILRCCGMDEAIVASTSVEYALLSSGIESATFYLYEDGIRYAITGAIGTPTGSLETGVPGRLSFTITGHFAGYSDTSNPAPTLDSTSPVAILGAGFTYDAYAAIVNTFGFDIGWTVATPPSINANDGYSEIIHTGRDVTATLDPELVAIATKDFVDDWQSGVSVSVSTGVIGVTPGNRFQISLVGVTPRDVSPGDRDGVRTLELPCGVAGSTGDDEISIIFT